MDFLLRSAQVSDLEQILDIYNAEILDGTANWNNTKKSSDDFQTWFSHLMTQQFPLFVAEHIASKKIAGYADYSAFRQIHGFKHTVEHSVFIHPDFTRQGLGKALMLKLIDHAQQHHIHVMVAAIDHDNKASIVLHEKLGFIQTGYLPQVGKKFGQWRDLVLMQLTFD
ncbi:GNAT family N-acetyltransferase [Acinetobacter sp. ANC 4470]|uniref:GNAT family N-acetyltransferase n=1 Tax=Acinetobacter sp. ANC 4470 TaxID=1977881 RepID=UPI000A32D57E|nr:GNAT family N-acetyltransferase [Acinetobacter sp. ANC 4470]OTG69522.1 GNAT family N-acetyltransferase [Acinetobacter sp. ANC 4470]